LRLTKKRKIAIGIVIFLLVLGAGSGVYAIRASHNPSFCATCHIIRPHYQSWAEGSLLAHEHAQEDVACLDCHESSYLEKAREGFIYLTGKYEDPMREREFSKEECLSCHEHRSYEQLVELTADLDPNPHNPPHYQEMECSLCHKMHRESEIYCAQCHSFEWIK